MEEMTPEVKAAIEELKAEIAKEKLGKKTPYENSWTAEGFKPWTAEDFERYGAKLAAEKEKKKQEMAKQEEEKKQEIATTFADTESADRAKIAARKQALLDKEGGRVRSQYGNQLSDDDVVKVINTENEMAYCKDCGGTYCKKIYSERIYKTAIWDEEIKAIKIVSAPCQRLIQSKYKLSKIPLAYIGKTLEDYSVDSNNAYAVEVAKKLIESPNKGAYFYGSVGTGKTFLASIIAQEVIKRGRNVIFATVPTISARIRSTFNAKEKLTEEDILEKLYTIPTLVLDDIGIEKPTRFVCSTLCNIFNERYNARLQTIMTSNYPLKALENIFNNPTDEKEPTFDGSRIYDRCKQMCIPIELKGNSRR